MNLVTAPLEGLVQKNKTNLLLGFSHLKYMYESSCTLKEPSYIYPKLSSKLNDFIYLKEIENSLRKAVFPILSQTCSIKSDHRYWNILIGHWLKRLINISYEAYQNICLCVDTYPLESTTFYTDPAFNLCCYDTSTMYAATNNPVWMHFFYQEFINIILPDLDQIHVAYQSQNRTNFENPYQDYQRSKGQWVKSSITNLLRNHHKNSKYFVCNSYLPVFQEIKLNIYLGQIPFCGFKNHHKILRPSEIDIELRTRLTDSLLDMHTDDRFYSILQNLFFKVFPICFLESYHQLLNELKHLPWSSNPSTIYTSNSFDTDEIFKLWTAESTSKGTRYYIGQHGCNYGTVRWNMHNSSVEEEVADCFLTWGWTNRDRSSSKPFFNQKIVNQRILSARSGTSLLLVQKGPPPPGSIYWNRDKYYAQYLDHQFQLVELLNCEVRNNLLVRLQRNSKEVKNRLLSKWIKSYPDIDYDFADKSIVNSIEKSRLTLFSYDSTGFLELLALNVPVMAFWQDDLDDKIPSVHPYYQLLLDAKIAHLSPSSCAAHINHVWEDIDRWWSSGLVQTARLEFVKQFSRSVDNPIKMLSNSIREGRSYRIC